MSLERHGACSAQEIFECKHMRKPRLLVQPARIQLLKQAAAWLDVAKSMTIIAGRTAEPIYNSKLSHYKAGAV